MFIKETMNDKIDSAQKRLQFILTIAAAIAALGGAFVTYKLAPLASDVSVLKSQVQAISDDYTRKTYTDKGFEHITNSLTQIRDDIKDLRNDLKLGR